MNPEDDEAYWNDLASNPAFLEEWQKSCEEEDET